MTLQKAAVQMKEEIKLHQLALIPPCPGPHNTVLKSFVSLETLTVSLATAKGDSETNSSLSSLDPSGVNFPNAWGSLYTSCKGNTFLQI